jgi:hypothetical protein
MYFMMPSCQPILRVQNAISLVCGDVIPLLGLGYSAKADAGLGNHFGSFKPKIILRFFLRSKKLLDFWYIFLLQFVPQCPFYSLNMQQSRSG